MRGKQSERSECRGRGVGQQGLSESRCCVCEREDSDSLSARGEGIVWEQSLSAAAGQDGSHFSQAQVMQTFRAVQQLSLKPPVNDQPSFDMTHTKLFMLSVKYCSLFFL